MFLLSFIVTIVCSCVFTLTTAILDRFLAIVTPSCVWITQKSQITAIIIIWAISLCMSVPWLVFQSYREVDWVTGHELICQPKFPSHRAKKTFYVSFFILVLLLPVILMMTLLVFTVIKTDKLKPSGLISTHAVRDMQRKVTIGHFHTQI